MVCLLPALLLLLCSKVRAAPRHGDADGAARRLRVGATPAMLLEKEGVCIGLLVGIRYGSSFACLVSCSSCR